MCLRAAGLWCQAHSIGLRSTNLTDTKELCLLVALLPIGCFLVLDFILCLRKLSTLEVTKAIDRILRPTILAIKAHQNVTDAW